MVERSLITDDVRALIGSTAAPVEVRVTRRAVQRTMDVYLGHHRRDFAPGDPVPGFVLAALEPEAEPVDVPNLLPDTLLISNEMMFERELRLDEPLVLQSRLADISERFGGRFGYSLYIRTEVDVLEPGGTLAARSVRTMMQYDAASAGPGEGE